MASQVNTGLSQAGAVPACCCLPLETSERADLFHPWARVPARWPLTDPKGVVPTRSQSNQYGTQVYFPRIGHWASGNGALMSLHPLLEPLQQDQQRLLMSTAYSPKSGPSHLTNLHHECFSHELREPKQFASGHTAGMQPRSAPEPRSVCPDPEPEAASRRRACWVLSTTQAQRSGQVAWLLGIGC